MEIFGNTYAFLATVEAVTTIAKACPDHDINKLDIWIGDSIVSVSNALKVMAPAMSKAYHDVQKELDPTYDGRILSPRLIDLLTIYQATRQRSRRDQRKKKRKRQRHRLNESERLPFYGL